ncbi:hypothetical protein INS49_005491 [Diaporthe citri]|uniref:uncharacterized protein n=1 Tax=Diaporthe citri TaxID=83186 RepID=UPI001C7E75AB|nr:uncharacterized protein INS49_005491 [Diaporthe citri]KAG6353529.1 hypothetical protein INS49_005491 [Diaporthe citri]
MEPDENAVTPRPESCRSVFELGFRAWSCYSQRVSRGAKQEALEGLRTIDHAFPGYPALPSGLNLEKSSDCWVASGVSFWDAAAGSTSSHSSLLSCGPGLPEVGPQKHNFFVTKSKPTKLTLSDSSDSGLLFLLGDKDDHVTILILAWAYILSARWTELIPGANNVQYTETRAGSSKHKPSNITVPIEAISGEAARWWQAVLVPGQGWLATADANGETLSPKVGFLWVGAAVLGAHTSLLDGARYGSFQIDLLSAAWVGTIQTFMQLPVSATQSGRIRREDECRLAYLASKEFQQNIPHTPWKPFGSVELKDSELDVQIHGGCLGHGLRYTGWAWDCWEDGRAVSVTQQPPAFNDADQQPVSVPYSSAEIPYDMLDLEHDSASGTATLNIFMWFRRSGFAASEQHIRRHEWLCEVLDDEEEEAYESWPEDDDDSACAVKKRPKSAAPSPKLGGWLASSQARREGSV